MDCVVPWLVDDIQATPCKTGKKMRRTPCCCGKYTFPTFELETADWSWSPITDDGGVHGRDKCLVGKDRPFCDHDNCVCWEGVTLRHVPCSLLDDSSD